LIARRCTGGASALAERARVQLAFPAGRTGVLRRALEPHPFSMNRDAFQPFDLTRNSSENRF